MVDVAAQPVLDLTDAPASRREWLGEVWAHRQVLMMLAAKDFQTRYKRASFGVIWGVAVPVLQATIMAVVFSHLIKVASGKTFAVFVMSGVIAFAYFGSVIMSGTTSIVEGASLTDKVWFPRVLLVIVPALSNLIGYVVTVLVLLAVVPLFGVSFGPQLLLLIPASLLLIAFTVALSLVLGALDVYFRDVKFLVQAALVVWIYLTPVLYPQTLLVRIGPWLDINPFTGVVVLFHMATVGSGGPWVRPVLISVGVTMILLVVGIEAQRRHDRLFVDLL